MKNHSPVDTGGKIGYQSMCTDVVIGVVIGKTTAYCRLQQTNEYTKADYSLRAKSQTSSPPRREDEESLLRVLEGGYRAILLSVRRETTNLY